MRGESSRREQLQSRDFKAEAQKAKAERALALLGIMLAAMGHVGRPLHSGQRTPEGIKQISIDNLDFESGDIPDPTEISKATNVIMEAMIDKNPELASTKNPEFSVDINKDKKEPIDQEPQYKISTEQINKIHTKEKQDMEDVRRLIDAA